jgi:hypothetical protein
MFWPVKNAVLKIAAGIALAVCITAACAFWYASRPKPLKPWDATALTASYPPSFGTYGKELPIIYLRYAEMCPGVLETRFYARRKIPALACGPGLLSVSHGPNEFVSLREMENCAAIYAPTAARLLGKESL